MVRQFYPQIARDLMIEREAKSVHSYLRWPLWATLEAGTLIDEDLLVTGNFGSRADENFASMKEFSKSTLKWPLMCMEFWDEGLTLKEPIIYTSDPEELAEAVHEVLTRFDQSLYVS